MSLPNLNGQSNPRGEVVPRVQSVRQNVQPTTVLPPVTNPMPAQNVDPYSVVPVNNIANNELPPPVPVDGFQRPPSVPMTRRSQGDNVENRGSPVTTSHSNPEPIKREKIRSRERTALATGGIKSPKKVSDRAITPSTIRTTSERRLTADSRSSKGVSTRSRSRKGTASTASVKSMNSTDDYSKRGSERRSTTNSELSRERSASVKTQTAASNRTSDSSGIRILDWVPLLVGKESPQYFSEGIQHLEGWISEPNPEYPVEILLGLEYISNVYKLEITVVDHLLPEKIEVRVGRGVELDRDMTYRSAREAEYELKGTITYEKPKSKKVPPEMKTIFIDYEAQYVWLTIFEPLRNRLNRTNQVRIGSLALYGYPLDRTRYSPFKPDTGITRDLVTRSSRTSYISLISRESNIKSNDRVREDDDATIIENDVLKSFGDNLTSDPLVSIRIAKRVLGRRIEKAERRGLDVQATVIQRAIERLNEYETNMLEMKAKMSTALTERDYDEAKHQFLSMIDVRDLAFRVIHLDLLLGQQE